MKPYGMKREDIGDVDVAGCVGNGRATRVAAVPKHGADAHTFRSLRGGKKAKARRPAKRSARREGPAMVQEAVES